MASPLAQATLAAAQRGGRGAPVRFYAPPRPPQRQRGPRQPEPQPRAAPGDPVANLLAQFPTAPTEEQTQEVKPEGFWGSDFGQGLGFVINNPVTRAVAGPLNYFGTGQRGVTLGIEEATEALAGAPDWVQGPLQSIPGIGNIIRSVDTERTEEDERSNWAKVFSPHSTYGYGELLHQPENPTGAQEWMNRFTGFGMDVATDPLTYVGGGASRIVTQAGRPARAADDLARATRALDEANVAAREALDVAQAAGARTRATDDAIDAATAARKEFDRATAASEHAAQFPAVEEFAIPTPRNRAERANLFGELSNTAEGRRFLEEFPGEALRGGVRGFQVMSPEAKAALRLEGPGLRLRGFDTKIPGTGGIADLINRGGGNLRAGLAAMPRVGQGAGRVHNIRVPRGLEKDYAVLTRGRQGDLLTAATHVGSRNDIRVGTGAMKARGNRTLTNMLREAKKSVGGDKDEIRRLVDEAETLPEANIFNDIPAALLDDYQKVTGRTIDPAVLREPATYLPHMMASPWRRALAKGSKQGDEAMQDFIKHAGLKQEELLEDAAFYADNLVEGSGFLEKARVFGPDPKTGEPQTFNIGGTDVTFSEPGLKHANEQLREAFPMWKGDFYETDPATIFEGYLTSLSRQAGRDLAQQKLVEGANPLVATMTGDVEAARQAMNESLAQQDAAPMLSTAQGRYDPTQPLPDIPPTPVVPGSAKDRAARAAQQAAQTGARTANTPEEAAAFAAEAAALPAPHPLGEVAEKYFVTTKGTEATAARNKAVGRARAYARAAAKETNVAETEARQAIFDVRENMIVPLRTSIKELDGEIKKANAAIKVYAKRVRELGSLSTETEEDLTNLILKVDQEIANAETKLKKTSATWKGRATRAQRKAEQRLRVTLDDLRKVRDAAERNIREAPERMQQEFNDRLEMLQAPVKRAQVRLNTKEANFVHRNPAPWSQADVDEANAIIKHGTEQPEMEGFDAMRDEYTKTLEQIDALNGKRRADGTLAQTNQAKMEKLVAKQRRLRTELQKGANQRATPYLEAQERLKTLEEMIPNAPRNQVKGLEKQRARLAAEFGPGGRFHEEDIARTVLRETEEYEAKKVAHLADETANLERAVYEQQTRQEAIIWATPTKSRRYGTRPGANPNLLEQMGWGRHQQRIPEPIIGGVGFDQPPQPAAWSTEDIISDVVGGEVSERGETVMGPGVVERPRPVPTPRTEEEALASMKGLLKYGSPFQQKVRMDLAKAEARLLEAAKRGPAELVAEKAKITAEIAAQADAELGPIAERVQTYTNLAQDLGNKQNLVTKRQQTRILRDRLKNRNPKSTYTDLDKTIDEIESVAKANPLLDDVKLSQVESILNTKRMDLQRIGETRIRIGDLDRVVADADDGKLGNVMIATTNNQWRAMHAGPLMQGDVIMDVELHKRLTNLFELNRQPTLLGRYFNAFTNLFKTYATLSPGFYLRNFIGGIFMNTADGVRLTKQLEGFNLFNEWMDRGQSREWIEQQPRRVQEAFQAAWASGAGGRFEDAGVLARTDSRLYNLISSNKLTRWGQRLGTRIEGAMRLGMALDSIDRGDDVNRALQRITRVHFDYSQVSDLDDTMKRIIPFWTFMSRNLPLQIQEMWTNPRVYAYYSHLSDNFSLPDEEFTPEYWTRQGAWRTPISIMGSPIYAQPDLGHTRVQQDIEMLGQGAGGEGFGKLLSQANPLIGATSDFINKRDSFYDRTYTAQDNKKLSGPIGTPVSMLTRLLMPSQVNEEGQVSENWTNYLTSLVPPLSQASRLAPGAFGGEPSAQTWLKRARYLGIPVQMLTPDQQIAEARRQWFSMMDEAERKQAMALEAATG